MSKTIELFCEQGCILGGGFEVPSVLLQTPYRGAGGPEAPVLCGDCVLPAESCQQVQLLLSLALPVETTHGQIVKRLLYFT